MEDRTPAVEKARNFAIEAHGVQSYDDKPYVTHLDDVCEVLRKHRVCLWNAEFESVVAYLHDVVEDTTANITGFGPQICAAVDFCTDRGGKNRRTRKEATRAYWLAILSRYGMSENPEDRTAELELPVWLASAVRVKVADRLANIIRSLDQDLFGMYRKEAEEFKKTLYIPGLCDSMWRAYDTFMGMTR
jgi:(p)ppGpp synthase/HD superfamily hydrolase